MSIVATVWLVIGLLVLGYLLLWIGGWLLDSLLSKIRTGLAYSFETKRLQKDVDEIYRVLNRNGLR